MNQHTHSAHSSLLSQLFQECNKQSADIAQLLTVAARNQQLIHHYLGLRFDATRTNITSHGQKLLTQLAQERALPSAIKALFDGLSGCENRMGRTKTFALFVEGKRSPFCFSAPAYSSRVLSDNNCGGCASGLMDGTDHPIDHGNATDFMQDLGLRRLHTGSFARGEYHGETRAGH